MYALREDSNLTMQKHRLFYVILISKRYTFGFHTTIKSIYNTLSLEKVNSIAHTL